MDYRKLLIGAAGAAVWTLAASAAVAQSTCPLPPGPPPESARPTRPGDPPPKPACIDARGNTSRCRRGEVERSNAQIDAFNEAIQKFNIESQTYLDALNHYVTDANTYSHCELDILNGKPH